MSKLTEQYRTMKIINSHDFAGEGNAYIQFYPRTLGRGSHSANYSVHIPGYSTDPGGPWYNYGDKTESCCSHKDKERALTVLKLWAGKRYKITEWVKTPYGTWMDAKFVKKRIAELKAQLKEVGSNL